MRIIEFLFLGLILTLFKMEVHFVNAIYDWTGNKVSVSSYWIFWILVGIGAEIFNFILIMQRRRRSEER